jgi:HAD superfamily hydrolase (TIGR01509 family)
MTPKAILFDFDGVLIDSEWAGNGFIANWLTEAGFPTRPEDAVEQFMGLAGLPFEAAVARWTNGELPQGFREARTRQGLEYLRDGIAEVAGASAFIQELPLDFPIAVTSSASSQWIHGHLDHLGLRQRFGEHVYSGREHVARSKPAPDLYLHAAHRLGVAIGETMIIEDSTVGVEGAVASGAHVVGLLAGSHVSGSLEARLLTAGVHCCVSSFEEIRRQYF